MVMATPEMATGGRWQGNTFQYNTAVTRVNTNVVHNTYINNSVNRNVNANRASFNGPNGIKAEPTAEQKAAAANAKKMGPTSQQLARQEAASKDQNLRASVNKGNPNADAIKSFNKGESAGQGKGAQELGAAGGAGAGAGKAENKAGNVTERNLQGGGKAGANGNKLKTTNQGNRGNLGGNQAKLHSGKMAGPGGPAHGPRAMNQMSRNPQMGGKHPQMGARNTQMGGKHPQMGGGNRPAPKGQPQGKKKQGEH